jgi:hypothetical protein
MKSSLKHRLQALAAAVLMNLALAVGLELRATQPVMDGGPQQLARASLSGG